MKKEINSKSRRKWIMGGLAAFASVALLTTGFAIYVVGVTKDKVNGDIGVTVDTARNESVLFTAQLDDNDKKITLGEPAVITDGFVKNQDVMEDLSVTFTKFEISVGEAVATNFNRIQLSLRTDPNADNGGAIDGKTSFVDNKAGVAKLDSAITNVAEKGRPETGATYFDLVTTTIDLPSADTTAETVGTTPFSFSRKTTNSTIKYELVTKNVKLFQWGSFFGGESPCTFYNRVLTAEHQTPENADLVQQEINEMNKTLSGKDICLHMELVAQA